jgi:RNA ligase (TIGR02306 family)
VFNKETGERCLAYPARILEVNAIPGLDREGKPYSKVEYAKILDWWCVVKAGEFRVGDWAIYFEIDSQTPQKPEYEFLRQRKFRIKTQKLCGVLSQGLCLRPEDVLPSDFDLSSLCEDTDLTTILGVVKYEPQEGPQNRPGILPGHAKGPFPSFIKKTDQDRVQNLGRAIESIPFDYEITEKLDGSSTTLFYRDIVSTDKESGSSVIEPYFGVCSRNLELKLESSGDKSLQFAVGDFVETSFNMKLNEKIPSLCKELKRNLAFQFEIVGPRIQKNKYLLSSNELRCFDIWDIDQHRYLRPLERRELCTKYSIPHVPVICANFQTKSSVKEILEMADGKTIFGNDPNRNREGLVFKHNIENFSFKAISNVFLLENK